MQKLAYAMCRRSDLADIQRFGFNHEQRPSQSGRHVTLTLSATEDKAIKTPFPRIFEDSGLEQGALLYIVLEGLDFLVLKDGSIVLQGGSIQEGIQPVRVGVLRMMTLGNRGIRADRVLDEEERGRRSEGARRSWATRRGAEATQDAYPELPIPTL